MRTAISINVQGLACARGERTLFTDLGFELTQGEVLAVAGANGAGKTSLLRILAGFLAPSAGSVSFVWGTERVEDQEERGKLIGWLGHNDAARAQLTPLELLEDFSALYRSQADAKEALDRVGLTGVKDLPCQYLSAGQRKRLALARLLMCSRTIWLLDEPLSALDRSGRVLTVDLINEHCRSGGITVVATHEPLEVKCRQLDLGGAGV